MKFTILSFITLSCIVTGAFAQNKIDQIRAKDGVHYITTTIDYPITGTYLFGGTTEPIIQLNPNGTGIFQLHDLSKTSIIWGIECYGNGEPKSQEGFDSAAYKFWYQNTGESDTIENWMPAEFSIHFETKKMYIMGERIKTYSEEPEHVETSVKQ